VTHVDLKNDRPDRATLLALLLGPSGNLRAPTIRAGRTLLVGFEPETYGKVFG
jgi:arsenate reductase-like glutaredoxin family protein